MNSPTISVNFPEGVALYHGVDSFGFPVWKWLKRIPDGKLVPGTMPKSVVSRCLKQQPQDAE